MHRWNWDDLRFVAVLAEVGTVAEAARRLKVNRTTVQRRLSAFEGQLRFPLFARNGLGLQPLPEAGPILDAARQIGEALNRIETRTTSAARDISGELSVNTTDCLLLSGIGETLSSFQDQHPNLQIHLSVIPHAAEFSRRKGEIAIQISDAPPEHLVGRRISDVSFSAYASEAYLDKAGPQPPGGHAWLAMLPEFATIPSEAWIADNVPPERIRMRADSFVALADAARLGHGIAVMPTCYGDSIAGLTRVDGLIKTRLASSLWILTHPDFRRTARVRALMDFLHESLSLMKHRFDA